MRSEAFHGRKALITGGLGFLGSNLAGRLLELGAQVDVLDNLLPSQGGNHFNLAGIAERVRVNLSDLCDEHHLLPLVRGRDYVFNLAGQTSHLGSMQAPQTDLEANCRAHLCLLETCRKHNPAVKVVFASTRQIYGRPTRLPVDEEHPREPVDINGIHKLAGESYHLLYHTVYGLRVCALRLTNTIGPRMRVKDARQTFLGLWVRRLIEGRPFEVWDGRQLRDFTYVDDAVQALLAAAASEAADGQVFNLGGDCVLSLRELADLLVEINDGGEYVVRDFPAERKGIDIGDYYADFARIRRVLGWQPRVPLREALSRTLAYYREHLPRYL